MTLHAYNATTTTKNNDKSHRHAMCAANECIESPRAHNNDDKVQYTHTHISHTKANKTT